MDREQDGGDGIWKTPRFLEKCHPGIRAVYRYWDGKRRGRGMPARSDFDPVLEVPRLLRHLILVDVHHDPLRLAYRLVGTGEAEMRGSDPTGKDVTQGFFGKDLETVLANYRYVIENRSFLYRNDPVARPGGWHIYSERLFMPLSENGETVDMIMIYTVWKHWAR